MEGSLLTESRFLVSVAGTTELGAGSSGPEGAGAEPVLSVKPTGVPTGLELFAAGGVGGGGASGAEGTRGLAEGARSSWVRKSFCTMDARAMVAPDVWVSAMTTDLLAGGKLDPSAVSVETCASGGGTEAG